MAREKHHLTDRTEMRQPPHGGAEVEYVVAVCGESKRRDWGGSGVYYPADTDDVTKITCPKCSKIMAERGLAALGDHGLTLEKYAPGAGYRSGVYRSEYTVRRHGEMVGVVAYDGGWRGGNWVVCALTTRDKFPETVQMGYEVEARFPRTPTERDPSPYYTRKPTLASKEAALLWIAQLPEDQRLKTAAEIVAFHKDWERRRAEGAIRRAEAEAEEARVTAETIEGLREIIALAEGGQLLLTNFQKTAVENALLLGFKAGLNG